MTLEKNSFSLQQKLRIDPDSWLAQSIDYAALVLMVVSSSSTFGVENS